RSGRARAELPREDTDDPSSRRIAGVHPVLLCGHSLVDNTWLLEKLGAHGYRVTRQRSLRDAGAILEREPAAIALLEASVPRQADALDLGRRLDHRCRRRVLVIVWRPARRLVRHFIDAGAGDFLTLPAPASEVLLRVELRVREARTRIFAERSELLPDVNRLS